MRPHRLCLSSSKGKLHKPRLQDSLTPNQASPPHISLALQASPNQAMIPSQLWATLLPHRARPLCLLWFQGNFNTVQPQDRQRHWPPTTETAAATQAMNPSLKAKRLGKRRMHRRLCCHMLPKEAGQAPPIPMARTPKVAQKTRSSTSTTSSLQLAAVRHRSKHLSFCRHKSL